MCIYSARQHGNLPTIDGAIQDQTSYRCQPMRIDLIRCGDCVFLLLFSWPPDRYNTDRFRLQLFAFNTLTPKDCEGWTERQQQMSISRVDVLRPTYKDTATLWNTSPMRLDTGTDCRYVDQQSTWWLSSTTSVFVFVVGFRKFRVSSTSAIYFEALWTAIFPSEL